MSKLSYGAKQGIIEEVLSNPNNEFMINNSQAI